MSMNARRRYLSASRVPMPAFVWLFLVFSAGCEERTGSPRSQQLEYCTADRVAVFPGDESVSVEMERFFGTMEGFEVEVQNPGVLTIWTEGERESLGQLRDSDCRCIATSEDLPGEGSGFLLRASVDQGIYKVLVYGIDQSEVRACTLHMDFVSRYLDDFPDTATASEPFTFDDTAETQQWRQNGWLDFDDRDVFRVDVDVPGTLTAFTEGDVDTTGILWDAGCAEILSDQSKAGGFHLQKSLSRGTYYVVVKGSTADEEGPFLLTLLFELGEEDDFPENHGGSVLFTLNRFVDITHEAELHSGDWDVFEIDVVADGLLTVSLHWPIDSSTAEGLSLRLKDKSYADMARASPHDPTIMVNVRPGPHSIAVGCYQGCPATEPFPYELRIEYQRYYDA